MQENITNIETADGAMETFVVSPGAERYPAVILYMDAPGIREELYDFARRIAGQAYTVLLPDMYYRLGSLRFDLSKGGAAEQSKMFDAMTSLSNALVMSDTKAMLDWMAGDPHVQPGPVGCIG